MSIKGQVENSSMDKCMDVDEYAMRERENILIAEKVWENLMKDQISLRSCKVVFDQWGFIGAKQRSVLAKVSCVSFRSLHCWFLTIIVVNPNLLIDLV